MDNLEQENKYANDPKLDYANAIVASFCVKDEKLAMTKVKLANTEAIAIVKVKRNDEVAMRLQPLFIVIDEDINLLITDNDDKPLMQGN